MTSKDGRLTLSKAKKMSSNIVLMIVGINRGRALYEEMRYLLSARFSSEIKVAQLGSAQLGTFIARLGSSWKILARAHH